MGPTHDQAKGTLVAQDLMAALNGGFDIPAFVLEVTTDHRTLQQNAARVVAALIEAWAAAGECGRWDARNEATVKWASEVMEKAPPQGFPFI